MAASRTRVRHSPLIPQDKQAPHIVKEGILWCAAHVVIASSRAKGTTTQGDIYIPSQVFQAGLVDSERFSVSDRSG